MNKHVAGEYFSIGESFVIPGGKNDAIVTVSEIFDRDAPPSRALSGQEKDRIIAIITDNLGRGEK